MVSLGGGSANHFYWNCGEQRETSSHLESPALAAKPSAATRHTLVLQVCLRSSPGPFSISEQGLGMYFSGTCVPGITRPWVQYSAVKGETKCLKLNLPKIVLLILQSCAWDLLTTL